MSPVFPVNDFLNASLAHREKIGQLIERMAQCLQLTNFDHFVSRQLSETVRLSPDSCLSVFTNHVLHILLVRCKPQMRGINTGWIVATVTNFKAIWHRTVQLFPQKSVCQFACRAVALCISPFGIGTKTAITSTVTISNPNPAFTWGGFFNELPKSINRCRGNCHRREG